MVKLSFLGIRIELHFSFFILIGIIFFVGNGFLAINSLIFSFLHEIAHGIVARNIGYMPEAVSAGLFGGVLHLKNGYVKPSDELLIHLSGPLFNLATAMLFYIIWIFMPFVLFKNIIISNIILAMFNLMPLYPLDGGKIIGLYLSFFFGYDKAYKVSKTFSLLFSVLLFLFGIYLVQYNLLNLLISALAINLYIVGREDSRYSYYRLMSIYKSLEKEYKTCYKPKF